MNDSNLDGTDWLINLFVWCPWFCSCAASMYSDYKRMLCIRAISSKLARFKGSVTNIVLYFQEIYHAQCLFNIYEYNRYDIDTGNAASGKLFMYFVSQCCLIFIFNV